MKLLFIEVVVIASCFNSMGSDCDGCSIQQYCSSSSNMKFICIIVINIIIINGSMQLHHCIGWKEMGAGKSIRRRRQTKVERPKPIKNGIRNQCITLTCIQQQQQKQQQQQQAERQQQQQEDNEKEEIRSERQQEE